MSGGAAPLTRVTPGGLDRVRDLRDRLGTVEAVITGGRVEVPKIPGPLGRAVVALLFHPITNRKIVDAAVTLLADLLEEHVQ